MERKWRNDYCLRCKLFQTCYATPDPEYGYVDNTYKMVECMDNDYIYFQPETKETVKWNYSEILLAFLLLVLLLGTGLFIAIR